jgi:hypothetical protein
MAHRVGSLCEDLFPPPKEFSKNAHVGSMAQYQSMYDESMRNPASFWRPIAESLEIRNLPPDDAFFSWNFNVEKGPIFTKWMEGAKANICYSALDLNLKRGLGNRVAFFWEGNDPSDQSSITYGELHRQVCTFANVLKKHGVKKGDRVAIYMPMIPGLVVAMLACARIGAPHSIVVSNVNLSQHKRESCTIVHGSTGHCFLTVRRLLFGLVARQDLGLRLFAAHHGGWGVQGPEMRSVEGYLRPRSVCKVYKLQSIEIFVRGTMRNSIFGQTMSEKTDGSNT